MFNLIGKVRQFCSYQSFQVWKKRGHILNQTSSGEACVAALHTQIESNHAGWSEMETF